VVEVLDGQETDEAKGAESSKLMLPMVCMAIHWLALRRLPNRQSPVGVSLHWAFRDPEARRENLKFAEKSSFGLPETFRNLLWKLLKRFRKLR